MNDTISMTPVEDMEKRSLYHYSQLEAARHKWLESEKAGRDLGPQAIREWQEGYWWQWLRARWIEHLNGEVFWVEFNPDDFSKLKRDFKAKQVLLDRIVDRIREGYENLDIIIWATNWGLNLRDVIEILMELDINASRLAYQETEGDGHS